MNYLPRIEEILLIAIWKLGDHAYGSAILKQVEEDTGTRWMSGAVYGALTRLLKQDYVKSKKEATKRNNVGRPRIYYSITSEGIEKLAKVQKINQRLWVGVPELKTKKQ
jgi:DNA-binding PadR family transcriptional regulator